MNDGRKRKAPKHQNKTAFKILFDPLALQKQKKVSFRGLCNRCADQIKWKLNYNKYKKMSDAAKCNFCTLKCVYRTYMRACQPCSQSRNVCPKCLQAEPEELTEERMNELQKKKQDQTIESQMNQYMKKLKERSRRTVKRLFDKGTIRWDKSLQTFVDEEDNPIPLHFRKGYGDNINSEDEDEEDVSDGLGDEQKSQNEGEKSQNINDQQQNYQSEEDEQQRSRDGNDELVLPQNEDNNDDSLSSKGDKKIDDNYESDHDNSQVHGKNDDQDWQDCGSNQSNDND